MEFLPRIRTREPFRIVGADVHKLRHALRTTGAEIEHLAIPRRAPEMEFEALRLIETGP